MLNTSVSDWQQLLDWLHSGVYTHDCNIGGSEATMPTQAAEMFQADLGPLLVVKVGSVELNCHFFLKEQIEFDLDPREIQSAVQAEQVFAFMGQLGRLLNKEVVLTPENMADRAIFRFLPDTGQIEYIP